MEDKSRHEKQSRKEEQREKGKKIWNTYALAALLLSSSGTLGLCLFAFPTVVLKLILKLVDRSLPLFLVFFAASPPSCSVGVCTSIWKPSLRLKQEKHSHILLPSLHSPQTFKSHCRCSSLTSPSTSLQVTQKSRPRKEVQEELMISHS